MKPDIGGQAVIDGILLMAKDKYVISTIKKAKIKTKKEKIKALPKILKLPFIRGISNLILILVIGLKALNYSANEQLGKKEKISTFQIILTIFFAFALAILLFKFIPLSVTQLINNKFLNNNLFLFNLTEGILKIIIFIIYIYLISSMKDVKTLFKYHGAEHKVVNCYENNQTLTLKNIKKFPTIHKRCGSTFIFLFLILSILVYSFLPLNLSFILKFIYRILLLPLIAAITYEIIKISSKFPKNILSRIFIFPGLLIQKLTTKEPNKKQLKVALTALKALKP